MGANFALPERGGYNLGSPRLMKHELRIRITVTDPPAGVWMKVQEGRNDLLEPEDADNGSLRFEFPVTVDLGSGTPNFLGKFAQGPKDARFIYVNSGSYAGQTASCWSRRAKLSLMSITSEMVTSTLSAKDGMLETTINGTGKDGGPVCASVKGIEWKVAGQ